MEKSFEAFEYRGWGDYSVCQNYDEHFGAVTVQSVEPMLDAANVQKGCAALDICTGAGYAAGAAAKRGAIALGIDFSQVQIDLAKEKYPNAEFQTGDATNLAFESNRFDAVVNGIGMPHFNDPNEAIREAFRVLKAGGKFAFTVYDKPQNSIGFGVIYSAVQLHGSMDIGLPEGPSFFLLSDPSEGTRRLEAAGFESVLTSTVQQTLCLEAPEELYYAVKTGSVRASATLQGQTSEAKRMIKAHIKDVVSQYRNGEQYEVPMPAVLYSASKPKSD